jgi:hypothetical protein
MGIIVASRRAITISSAVPSPESGGTTMPTDVAG